MIHAAIFDIGGVVAHLDWDAFDRDWCVRLGLPPRGVLRAIFEGSDDQPLVGKVSAEDWWRGAYARLSLDEQAARGLGDDLSARASIDRAMLGFIRGLRTGVRTAFCSNAWSDAATYGERDGYRDAVDHFVTSAAVGVAKPNEGIYRRTLALLGVGADEALFVDDSPANVEAARALGIHGILHRSTPETIEAVRALL